MPVSSDEGLSLADRDRKVILGNLIGSALIIIDMELYERGTIDGIVDWDRNKILIIRALAIITHFSVITRSAGLPIVVAAPTPVHGRELM